MRYPYAGMHRYKNPISALGVRNADPDAQLRALLDALFSNGEQGAVYVPKPVVLGRQVLWQDEAGVIPAVSDGDPVGMILDLSKNLDLGPELSQWSSGFSSLTGVSGANATVSLDNSGVLITTTASSPPSARGEFQISGLTVGDYYQIEVDWVSVKNSGIQGPNAWTATSTPVSARGYPGNLVCRVIATNQSGLIRMYSGFSSSNLAGDAIKVNKISIRKIPGNHATAPSSSARYVYRTDGVRHWLDSSVGNGFPLASPITTAPNLIWAASVRPFVVPGTAMMWSSDDQGATGLAKIGVTSGALFLRFDLSGTGGGTATTVGSFTANEDYVHTAQRTTTHGIVRKNAQVIDESSYTGSDGPSVVSLFGGKHTQAWQGRIYGFVCVNSGSVVKNVELVDEYLAKLAGVTL